METIDSDFNKGNVLVVDDDPAVGKVLIAQLAQAGIGVSPRARRGGGARPAARAARSTS